VKYKRAALHSDDQRTLFQNFV